MKVLGFVAKNRLNIILSTELLSTWVIIFVCILFAIFMWFKKFCCREGVDEIVKKINQCGQATKFNDEAEMSNDIRDRSPFHSAFKVRSIISFKKIIKTFLFLNF